jgi:hypothetical protein
MRVSTATLAPPYAVALAEIPAAIHDDTAPQLVIESECS